MARRDAHKRAARRAAVLISSLLLGIVGVWVLPRVSSAAAGWAAVPPIREHTVRLDGGLAVGKAAKTVQSVGGVPAPAAEGGESTPAIPVAAGPVRTVDAGMRFDMVGLLCDERPAVSGELVVNLRASADGRAWGPWFATDLVVSDAAERREGGKGPAVYTDPVWVGSARYLQLRVVDGPRGEAPKTLDRVRLMFLNTSGDGTTGDRLVSALRRTVAVIAGIGSTPTVSAMTAAPAIVKRADWGANESWRTHSPDFAPVKMAFVHHTVNSNSYTRAQAPGIVRGIYYYDSKGLKWSDLGYNFLIDRYGTVYEGRYGGVTKGVIGAQVLGFNTSSTGIAMIGTFTSASPPSAMMASLKKLLAWKLDVHHVDPQGKARMLCRFTRKFREGETVVFPVIAGHRQANWTACPGDALYRLLPGVRRAVGKMGLPKIYDYRVGNARISPNGDGVRETTRIRFVVSETAAWSVEVADAAGEVVRRLSGSGDAVDVRWDGRDDAGTGLPDGAYAVTGRATAGGRAARAAKATVRVDTVAPTTTALTVTPAVFSPNGDGYADRSRVRFSTTEACSARVSVVNDAGTVLRGVTGWQYASAGARVVTWDGKVSSSGALVGADEGEATLRLELKDAAGNRSSELTTTNLDRTLGFLTARPATFSPNGDGVKDVVALGWTLTRRAAVATEITREGDPVRTFTPATVGAGTHSVTWDGLLADGTRARSGKYRFRATATSAIGTVSAARWVTVDRYRPRLSAPTGVSVTLGKRARVNYSVKDPYSGKVRVIAKVRNRYGRTLATIDCGWVAVDTRSSVLWRPPSRRTYTVTLTATDRGGNRQYRAVTTKITVR